MGKVIVKNLLLILALFIVGFISVDDLFAELSSENIQTYEWKSLKGRDLNTFRYKDDFFTLDTTKGKSKVYFKIDRENYIVSLKTKHPIKIQQLETRHVDWFLNPVYAKKGENLKKDFCTALLFTSTKIEPKRKLELEKFPFSKKQRYIYYHESNEVDYICFKPGERERIVKEKEKQIAEKKLAKKIAKCKTYGFEENTDGMGLCLIELDKLALLEEQILAIEKRNNQIYLQNQQQIAYQKRQREAQALINLGATISGAGIPQTYTPDTKISNTYSDFSSTLTIPSNQVCPILSTPVTKQEVIRGNRICYYQ